MTDTEGAEDAPEPIDAGKLCRAILQDLQTSPEHYKRFGVWWWFIKAMLKRAGYGRDQLYMLGSWQDPETAALVPPANLNSTIRAAMLEYRFNTIYPRSDGKVETADGELVEIKDDDAGF